ncbi:MAG: dipeptidyl-peptidase-4 [Chlamydiales bacterium]|jgi:dipeptidyl-peptidase-4
MTMQDTRKQAGALCTLLCALALTGCNSSHSSTRKTLSVEWIYSPAGRAIDDVPQHAWRSNGTALLWDSTRETPGFELMDPGTGMRSPHVDRERALASLEELLAEETDAPWRWPDALDSDGDQGLYTIAGDVFVLDLNSSTFQRLTDTEEEETSASFSPDGRHVAFVRANDLWVVNAGGGNEARLTHDGSETTLNGTLSWVYWEELFGRRDIGYWWSPDSRSIAYMQSDESAVGTVQFPTFAEPYAEPIIQRYPKAGSANPSVRVGVLEIGSDTPQTTWIELAQEHEYVARVKWLPDSERLSVQTLTRDQCRLDLVIADASSGRSRAVLTETDDAWVNINDDLYFLADGERFLWASERSGYSHLYMYNLSGDLLQQVTSGDWAIASSGGGVFWLRQAVCAIDENQGWIYYTSQEHSPIERHLHRIRFDGSERERLTATPGTHAISFAPGNDNYIDTHSELGNPPTMSMQSCATGTKRDIARSPAERAGLKLQVPEFIEVTARDGQALPAWILKPHDFDPSRRYPLIMYVYGGPSAPTVANAWDDDLLFDQLLLDAGYLVARCDNRSSTAISKQLESTVKLRSIGDVERDDYVDAARWFKSLPFVDDERVGIWGWSGGGSMTLLMLTRSTEFKAGIAVAPVTDWTYYDTKWAEFTMKRPEDNPEGYAHTRLVNYAKDLHGRLLLVHGTYDDNVHPQNSWAFIDELVTAGVAFDMMMYPMRKHGISDTPARVHLFEKMLEFWELYL